MRVIVILFIIVILGSLGSALYYMVRDRGTTERTAKALTIRIVLSIALFLLLMLGFHTGLITTRLYTAGESSSFRWFRQRKKTPRSRGAQAPDKGNLLPVQIALCRFY